MKGTKQQRLEASLKFLKAAFWEELEKWDGVEEWDSSRSTWGPTFGKRSETDLRSHLKTLGWDLSTETICRYLSELQGNRKIYRWWNMVKKEWEGALKPEWEEREAFRTKKEGAWKKKESMQASVQTALERYGLSVIPTKNSSISLPVTTVYQILMRAGMIAR